MKCVKCGKEHQAITKCPYCDTPVPVAKPVEKNPALFGKGLMEYKVVGAEDQWMLGGRFDKEALQNQLNYYAVRGWKVKEMVLGKTVSLLVGFQREEITIVLERPYDYTETKVDVEAAKLGDLI